MDQTTVNRDNIDKLTERVSTLEEFIVKLASQHSELVRMIKNDMK